jgi:RNA polymerase sigma-70 factor (ECF subfamily)
MDHSRQAEDQALLAASARGDREAFAAFYRRHLAPVVAHLVAATGDRELAADLAAEVFAAALLGAARYRPERSSALPWLCGIARNKLSETRRRGRAEDRARRRLGIPRESLEDTDLARVDELAREGTPPLEALDLLPDEQRDAVWARVVEERDYEEIARAAGTSEVVVRQRVSRALSRMRAAIREED